MIIIYIIDNDLKRNLKSNCKCHSCYFDISIELNYPRTIRDIIFLYSILMLL